MAVDKDKFARQVQQSGDFKVQSVAGKLRMQFNHEKRCTHHDWASLARSVGLSEGDIPAIKRWVSAQGLSEPKRPKPTGKSRKT